MTNLGHADLGDSVRIETTITNISDVVANVDEIAISILDDPNTKIINTTTVGITNSATGKYYYDAYLDDAIFSEGVHYVIWSGYNIIGEKNFSFIQEDSFYIEENRLI